MKVVSLSRLVFGFMILALTGVLLAFVLIVLLPFRKLRILTCNFYAQRVLPAITWAANARVSFKTPRPSGRAANAIYVANHTSVLDLFLASMAAPMGTVGIAKQEIIYYPVFGQLWFLSGHLRINRRNRDAAIRSMNTLSDYVESEELSMFLFPEGTRSRDGKLKDFKKGFVHLALATGLPIVPVVIKGAFKAWPSKTFDIPGGDVEIEYLDPIPTHHWRLESVADHIREVRQKMIGALPFEQRPDDSLRSSNTEKSKAS